MSDPSSSATGTRRRSSAVTYTDRGTRQGHIASLLGMSLTDPAVLQLGPSSTIPRTRYDGAIHAVYAGFLAWKHLNERNGKVLPSLPERLANCDFEFTYQSIDTMFSPQHAVQHLMNISDPYYNKRQQEQQEQQQPFAIVGSFMSEVTVQLAMLATGLELPQISGVSPSAVLDQSPYFARTFTTDAAHAKAALYYLHYSLEVTHVVFLVIDDPCCTPYSPEVRQLEQELNMTIFRILYTPDTIHNSMQQLKDSGYRYIFLLPIDVRTVLQAAVEYNVMGNANYTWFLAERSFLADDTFSLDRETESNIANALHGVGLVNFNAPDDKENPAFEQAMLELTTNTTLQQEFLDIQSEPELFDTYNFSKPHAPHIYQKLTYDAVIALGIAACDTPGLFTGPEFYHTLVRTEFEGVSSGRGVAFDHTTGTRTYDTVRFIVQNIRLSEQRSDATNLRFETRTAGFIQGSNVSVQEPFLFYDNTTTPPPSLPPIQDANHHLIPLGIQIFGYLMAGAVILLSLFFLAWTWIYRKSFVVRMAQPTFLAQLCIGCFVMALTIFPLSMQSTQQKSSSNTNNNNNNTPTTMDAACVSIDWLAFGGFTIAVSALLAKTLRINGLINHGLRMRRIQLRPRDVMLPFAVLLAVNMGILASWTILSPRRYTRIPMNGFDMYNRNIQSYGACRSDNEMVERVCWILLVVTNTLAVALACWQCYQARDLPVAFSETKYLAYSMSFLLEAFVVGAPSLSAARDDPSATFLTGSILICLVCLSMLLPVFFFKYRSRSMGHTRSLNNHSSSFLVDAPERRRSGQQYSLRGSAGYHNRAFGTEDGANQQTEASVAEPTDPDPCIPGQMRITRRS